MRLAKDFRIAFIAVLAVVALVAVTALVGLGVASSGKSAAAAGYQYGKKVTICHKGRTITVSVNAMRAHMAHGDKLGPCTATARSNGNGKGKGKGKPGG